MNEPITEVLTETLVDAEAANLSVEALVEILQGCPADYPLSAGLFLGLLVSVRAQMFNVVDGLRAIERNGVPA